MTPVRPDSDSWKRLDAAARRAARRSAALSPRPARGARGAALLCGSGAIYIGAELGGAEGAALSAERAAAYAARLAGERRLLVLVVRGDGSSPSPPNAATLQVLFELAPTLSVHWAPRGPGREGRPVSDLLPHAFGPRSLLAPGDARTRVKGGRKRSKRA